MLQQQYINYELILAAVEYLTGQIPVHRLKYGPKIYNSKLDSILVQGLK